jgi:uncharacterized protein YjbJ (UPF0337 family)
MNKDQVKGKVDNVKGRAKEAAGVISGDEKTEVEGLAERVKGATQEKLGDLKHKAARKIEEDDNDE